MLILYLLYGNRYLIRFMLSILMLLFLISCACMSTFPFNDSNIEVEPLYLLSTQKYIQNVKPVICSCLNIPCISTVCHQERYEITNYNIGTIDGNIIFTKQESERLENEWVK